MYVCMYDPLSHIRFSKAANKLISEAAISVGSAKQVDPHLAQVSLCMYVCMYMYACMYAFVYVCMYVCTYVCVCSYV